MRKRINSLLGSTALLLGFSAVSLCAHGQSYTIKFTGDSADTGTVYISPNAVRKVSESQESMSALNHDVIDRVDRGTIIFINHKNKTYQEHSVAEIKGYLDQQSEKMSAAMRDRSNDPRAQEMLHQMGANQEPTVQKLGSGGVIAGYPTERYLLKGPMAQAELWITQSLQFPAAYYRDFNVLNGVSMPLGKWDKVMDLHGVILKKVITMPGGMTLSDTAISVDKSSIPASAFEPPADYRKIAARPLGQH